MEDANEWLTLNQAAEVLGVSRQHMRRLALEFSLEAFTTPADRRARLFRREDVLRLRQPRRFGEVPPKVRPA
ncbi:MAG TPA: helix-turn-helix domain-containing protein [Chloroflexota bacterium]|nr:helix-turn-helix domain-containing protein [Chloroflexota bacterium]